MRRSAQAAGNPGAGSGRAGFTLIEVMMAMVVMSLGVFAVIQLQVVAIRGNAYARERTEAYEIALGVAEEMRLQSLRWKPGTVFSAVFYNPSSLPNPGAQPLDGVDILDTQLQTFPFYNDTPLGDSAFENADPINVFGALAGAVDGQRSIYRVHYAMYQVRPAPGLPVNPGLVRVTVLVSWDNKDHGLQTGAWENPALAAFWNRHMIAITFYLAQVL
ncbi:MAG TPA: prepilin-type N-terminal cleavage/methylation domain-containing protein [Myxococcota bacterium]|nr:prepilin-type N-terminal cleavage/methylation domain-containing protein [Myxococcota bacterium]HRY95123.1 prepilin-type N-terminal cleavage/methylation domain-containing protein [Myxococcota bacterium]HSA23051.1 prepilin-type N-terminal cleavage/methylation domain-containing protein [Myxococcota bacterium]